MDDKRILAIRDKVFAEMAVAEDSFESAALLYESEKYRTCIPLFRDSLLSAVKSLLMLHTEDLPETSRLLEEYNQKEWGKKIGSDTDLNEILAKLQDAEKDSREHPLDLSKESIKAVDTTYKQIESFLAKANKFIKKTLRTTQELKKRQLMRKFAFGLIGAAVVAVVLFLGIRYVLSQNNGLTGTYFAGQNFEKLIKTQTDKKIDFQWGLGKVAADHSDHVSIRWTGRIKVPRSGEYRFITKSDDGARLWIDDKLIINDWNIHAAQERRGIVKLEKGSHKIKLEYFEAEGFASIQLMWIIPGTQGSEVISPSYLRKTS
ncbi:MAG: PA14 domain-containing protein [Candidatus Aminicenantes bacterium]